jgi:glutathione S-transferase
MKLYTSILCPFAHRVRIVLAEKGVEVSLVEVDPRKKPKELVELGWRGTVPVLEIQDHKLSESAVIAEYLDETYPIPALMPRHPAHRAEARLWMRCADQRLYPHTRGLLYAAPAAERLRLQDQIHEDLRYMESRILDYGGPYWLGERFSLVDATFFPWFEQRIAIERFRGFTWPGDCPKLLRWHAQVAARPAVRATSQPPEFYERAYAALAAVQAR